MMSKMTIKWLNDNLGGDLDLGENYEIKMIKLINKANNTFEKWFEAILNLLCPLLSYC